MVSKQPVCWGPAQPVLLPVFVAANFFFSRFLLTIGSLVISIKQLRPIFEWFRYCAPRRHHHGLVRRPPVVRFYSPDLTRVWSARGSSKHLDRLGFTRQHLGHNQQFEYRRGAGQRRHAVFNSDGNSNTNVSLGNAAQAINTINFDTASAAAYNLGVLDSGDQFIFDASGSIVMGTL